MNANGIARKDACIGIVITKEYCENLATQCDEQQGQSKFSIEGQSVGSYMACLEKARELASEKETPNRNRPGSLLNRDLTLNFVGSSSVNVADGQIGFQRPQPGVTIGFPGWAPVFGRPFHWNSTISFEPSGGVRGEALGLRWLHTLNDQIYLQPSVSVLRNNDTFNRTGYDIGTLGFELYFQLLGKSLSDAASEPLRYLDFLGIHVGSEAALSQFPDGEASVSCGPEDSACGRLPHLTTTMNVGIEGAWHTGGWELRGAGKLNYVMAPNAAVNSLDFSVYRRISQALAWGLDANCQYLKSLGQPMTGYTAAQDGGKCYLGLGISFRPLIGRIKTYDTAEEWNTAMSEAEAAEREASEAQAQEPAVNVSEAD